MPTTSNLSARVRRPGVTLVELLIVLSIILLVSSVGLTLFTPSLPSRQLRESSREFTALLQGARDRAMRTKRRVGVQIERLRDAGDANAATANLGIMPSVGVRATLVEEPPPYSGDYVNSVMRIVFKSVAPFTDGNGYLLGSVVFIGQDPTSSTQDIGWNGQFREGTLIEFGTQGHQFLLKAPPDTSVLDTNNQTYIGNPGVGPDMTAGTNDDLWPVVCLTYRTVPQGTITGPFRIIRDPVTSSVGGVDFPPQVAIDLAASGLANSSDYGDEFNGLQSAASPRRYTDLPVQIFFGPDGGVFRVRYGGWSPAAENSGTPKLTGRSPADGSTVVKAPTSAVCLMLGKIEQITLPDLNEPQLHTWQDPDSLWVTIDPVTGRIKSDKNNVWDASGNAITTGTVTTAADKRDQLANARRFALDAQTLGGR